MSNKTVVCRILGKQTIKLIKALPSNATIESIESLGSDMIMSVVCSSVDWLNSLNNSEIKYNSSIKDYEYSLLSVDYNQLKNKLTVIINYYE